MTQTGFYTRLNNRGLIKISGKDRLSFLQGLITQDIKRLESETMLYSCLLSSNGKFLHDFFIIQQNEDIIIDCEGQNRTEQLAEILNTYKLRSQITMEILPENIVYNIWGGTEGYKDPRHPKMGNRSLKKPSQDIEEKPFSFWDITRIQLCIPDGSRDLIPGKSTLSEGRIDTLDGVSYSKGCYIGQELTARMHYRGLAKKHLYAIRAENLPDTGQAIINEEKTIGEMRSSCGEFGMALLKDEEVQHLPLPLLLYKETR